MESEDRIRRRIVLAQRLRDVPPDRTILMACDLTEFARRLAGAADLARR